MRHKLTPGFVKKADLPEKGDRVLYWDTEVRGFGLQITRNGHRSFIVQYRFHGFSQRMATDSVLTLDRRCKARSPGTAMTKRRCPVEFCKALKMVGFT